MMFLLGIIYLLMSCITYKMMREQDRREGNSIYKRKHVILLFLVSFAGWIVLFWIALYFRYDWKVSKLISKWLDEDTTW